PTASPAQSPNSARRCPCERVPVRVPAAADRLRGDAALVLGPVVDAGLVLRARAAGAAGDGAGVLAAARAMAPAAGGPRPPRVVAARPGAVRAPVRCGADDRLALGRGARARSARRRLAGARTRAAARPVACTVAVHVRGAAADVRDRTGGRAPEGD